MATKQTQIAEFQALYYKAYNEFMEADEGAKFLDVLSSLLEAAAPAPEPEPEPEAAPEEKKEEKEDLDADDEPEQAVGVSSFKTEKTFGRARVRPNDSSIIFSDEVPEMKTSVRTHASPGGKSSIRFGEASTVEGAHSPTMGSKKVTQNIGGNSDVTLGSGGGVANSVVTQYIEKKKCLKLADAIYKAGNTKAVFTKFCGDQIGKTCTKKAFYKYAVKELNTGLSQDDVHALFKNFTKDGQTMKYSGFVKLLSQLGTPK